MKTTNVDIELSIVRFVTGDGVMWERPFSVQLFNYLRCDSSQETS